MTLGELLHNIKQLVIIFVIHFLGSKVFLLLVEWYNSPMSKSQKVSPLYYLFSRQLQQYMYHM